jgi:hypothetical protein
MGASGAGLNRVGLRGGELLLSLLPASTGAALDSGIQMTEAIGFKDFAFQFIGPGAQTVGYSVTVYGTLDPAIYVAGQPVGQPTQNVNGVNITPTGKGSSPTALLTSWFILPGPSEQGSTGVMANPMLSGTAPILRVNWPLVAVRAVATILTGGSAPTNGVQVVCFAVS